MSFVLEVQNWNSQAIEAVLDDTLFYIVLDWNDTNKSWTMSIHNSSYNLIMGAISLVPNYPLTWQFRYSDMPKGELYVISNVYRNGPIPLDGFETGNYELVYRTEEEIIEAGVMDSFGKTNPDAF